MPSSPNSQSGRAHTVAEGECILSIAEREGHFWETIWNDPANDALRHERPDGRTLLPGDRLTIPPLREREESRPDGERHRFRRRGVPYRLRLRFLAGGKARADVPYTLDVDGVLTRGRTDGDGALDEYLPPNAQRGVLRLGEGDRAVVYEFRLAALPPWDTLEGAQARLRNLGYDTGGEHGVLGPNTAAALRRFQLAHSLSDTGADDAPTRSKLKETHGS